MPHAGMRDALGRGTLGEFREIEAGAEVLAGALQHQRLDALRHGGDAGIELLDHRVAQRVALGGPVQAQDPDLVFSFETQQSAILHQDSAVKPISLISCRHSLASALSSSASAEALEDWISSPNCLPNSTRSGCESAACRLAEARRIASGLAFPGRK